MFFKQKSFKFFINPIYKGILQVYFARTIAFKVPKVKDPEVANFIFPCGSIKKLVGIDDIASKGGGRIFLGFSSTG